MIYYIIAVDILAEKASTLKYASVISQKSETFSLIWFKELAWTAQKAVFNSDRWWGGRRNYTPGAGDTQESATNFSRLRWRNYNREETSENWQRNPPCCRDLLLHHSGGCPARTLTLHPWNPSSSHAVSKDPTNSRGKTRTFFALGFSWWQWIRGKKSFRQQEKELQWKNPRLPLGSRRHLVGTARGQTDTRTEMKTSISFSSWFL